MREVVRSSSRNTPLIFEPRKAANSVYVLELPMKASGAAGDRVEGTAEMKIARVHRFEFASGVWTENDVIKEAEKLERFEIPYYAASLGVTMSDGFEQVVTGVIDPGLIKRYESAV